MAILNYTTQISADKSIAEIQKILAKGGAKAILTEYDDNGFIVALSFKIVVDGRTIGFKLPSDWRPILQILNADPRVPSRLKSNEQAIRVSWRIIKDWVEAQMAIIETKMVKPEQVFLPYAVTNTGQTVYEQVVSGGMLLGKGTNEKN